MVGWVEEFYTGKGERPGDENLPFSQNAEHGDSPNMPVTPFS